MSDQVPRVPGAPGGGAQSEFVMRWGGFGAPGPKGDQGEQGEEGRPGTRLPRGQARAVVYLFVLNMLFVAACFTGLIHYVHAGDQERCTTINEVTSIPVPQPVAGNPSRMWESRFEAIEKARGRQLGCR